jgi:solute carrier family 25 phosphate transporter 3
MLPDSIISTFAAQHPLGVLGKQQPTLSNESLQEASKRREPFSAWSAIDDVKKTADSIAHEAAREYNIASHKAQEKAGKIEMWTPKYYASCTFGGLLACVSIYHPRYPNDGIQVADTVLYRASLTLQ